MAKLEHFAIAINSYFPTEYMLLKTSTIKQCADGVVVIAISLYTEVPGSIPERGKKRRFL